MFSGLVVFVNGVELHRSPLPTLVHRSALRYRQNLSAQQVTLHYSLGLDSVQTRFQNNKLTLEWDPDLRSKALGSKVKYAMSVLCLRSISYNQLIVSVLRNRTK